MNPHDIQQAMALYNTAIAAGASHNNAIQLVGSAYQESSFNPQLTGSDHGTSFGLMQVGSALWNQMQQAGVANDPTAQLNYYINALQSHAPQTWESMQNASSPQAAFQALYSNPDWRMGTAGLSDRFGYYNQLAQTLGAPPIANQGSNLSGAPVAPGADPLGNLQVFGSQQGMGFDPSINWGSELPQSPSEFQPTIFSDSPQSQFNPNEFALPPNFDFSSYLNSPSGSSDARPGFADLSGAVPPGQFPSFNPEPNNFEQPNPVDIYGLGLGNAAQNFAAPSDYVPFTDFSSAWQGYDPISASIGGNDISQFGGNTSLGNELPPSPDFGGQPGVPGYLSPPDASQGDTQAFIDSLFAPQPSPDYMFGTGAPGTTEAVTDWNTANQQYGAGNWYYDNNGNIQVSDPFGGAQAGGSWLPQAAPDGASGGQSAPYDPLQQGSVGQPGGVPSVQGTIVQGGKVYAFDPTIGAYVMTGTSPTGVYAANGPFSGAGSGNGGVGPQFSGGGGYNPSGFSPGSVGGVYGQGLLSSIAGMTSAALNQGMPLIGGGPPDDPMGSRGGTV